MKVVSATVFSCLMFTASVAFADVTPLTPGKPAGVHNAQFLDGDNGIFIVAGAALIGITAALASASNGPGLPNNTGSTSTSTGTSP
jgi:hypothetical protein